MNGLANDYVRGNLMHHQEGADSLRLRLLLIEMMVFCLHYNEDCCRATNGLSILCIGQGPKYVSKEIRDAVNVVATKIG